MNRATERNLCTHVMCVCVPHLKDEPKRRVLETAKKDCRMRTLSKWYVTVIYMFPTDFVYTSFYEKWSIFKAFKLKLQPAYFFFLLSIGVFKPHFILLLTNRSFGIGVCVCVIFRLVYKSIERLTLCLKITLICKITIVAICWFTCTIDRLFSIRCDGIQCN